MMRRPDFEKAAELYVNSAEAQHGDVEMARYEAEEWWRIFEQVQVEGEAPAVYSAVYSDPETGQTVRLIQRGERQCQAILYNLGPEARPTEPQPCGVDAPWLVVESDVAACTPHVGVVLKPGGWMLEGT